MLKKIKDNKLYIIIAILLIIIMLFVVLFIKSPTLYTYHFGDENDALGIRSDYTYSNENEIYDISTYEVQGRVFEFHIGTTCEVDEDYITNLINKEIDYGDMDSEEYIYFESCM